MSGDSRDVRNLKTSGRGNANLFPFREPAVVNTKLLARFSHIETACFPPLGEMVFLICHAATYCNAAPIVNPSKTERIH
jgi:hypothetical protein